MCVEFFLIFKKTALETVGLSSFVEHISKFSTNKNALFLNRALPLVVRNEKISFYLETQKPPETLNPVSPKV